LGSVTLTVIASDFSRFPFGGQFFAMPQIARTIEATKTYRECNHPHGVVPQPREPCNTFLKMEHLTCQPLRLKIGNTDHIGEDYQTEDEEGVEESQ
jgi:hypothetical protein